MAYSSYKPPWAEPKKRIPLQSRQFSLSFVFVETLLVATALGSLRQFISDWEHPTSIIFFAIAVASVGAIVGGFFNRMAWGAGLLTLAWAVPYWLFYTLTFIFFGVPPPLVDYVAEIIFQLADSLRSLP